MHTRIRWTIVVAALLVQANPGAATTPTVVTASGQFRDVAFGDLNEDGLLDMVATSNGNAGIKAFVVDASRKWTEQSTGLPNAGNFNGVVLADLDHNGRLDIVAGSEDNDGVKVYLRTGPTTWTNSSTGLPGLGFVCSELAVADFNNDGNPDILAASSNNRGVRLYEGDGTGGWTAVGGPTPVGSYWGVVVWDWVGNGLLDVIAASRDDLGLVFWRHNPLHTFTSSDFNLPHTGNYCQIAIGDADHDGLFDVLATKDKGIEAYSGDEPRFPSLSTGLPTDGAWWGIAAGNYPPDTYLDLIAGSGIDKGISANRGMVGGSWEDLSAVAGLPASGTFWDLAIADSNRDGMPDVAGAPVGNGIRIWYNEPIVFTPEWISVPAPASPEKGISVAGADFDRDGATDLVIGADGMGLKLWAGDGGSSWTDATPAIFTTSTSIRPICIGDFDGDYKPDIVAGSSDGAGIFCYRNQGYGNWEERRVGLPTGGVYPALALADVNNDGKKELLAGHELAGLRMYLYDPAAGRWFFILTSPLASGTVNGVVSADFNHDGLRDIAVALQNDGLRAWAQRPAGTWTDFLNGLPNSPTFANLVAVDFDNDSFVDLIGTPEAKGIAAYRNRRGSGDWLSVPAPSVGKYTSLSAADYNLDGRVDLLACGDNNGLSLYVAEAAGGWVESTTGSLPTSGNLNAGAFARVDFDATPDIVAVDGPNYAGVYLSGDGTPPGNWQNFTPDGWVQSSTVVTCTVEVSETISGLDTTSAQYEYSTDFGNNWNGPYPATCSDASGALHTTITAADVPFNQEAVSENRIRFYIADMNGNVGQSPIYRVQMDETPPPNPTITDTFAHTAGEWSRYPTLRVGWSTVLDGVSGCAGYSYVFDNSPGTVPDETIENSVTERIAVEYGVADGNWYFHVRAIDRAGNAAVGARHAGPFRIDTTPPDPPTLSVDSHATGTYTSDNVISVAVALGGDSFSGSVAVRYCFNQYESTPPVVGREAGGTPIRSDVLAEGHNWYCHAQTKDRAGNYSEPTHLGPFRIDRTPPNCWIHSESISGSSDFRVEWGGMDFLCGLSHFNVQKRRVGEPGWTSWFTGTTAYSAVTTGAAGQSYEFRAQSVDNVGNTSAWTVPVRTRVGKSVTVIVRNEAGSPVADVPVYHNDRRVGWTRAPLGALTVPDVLTGDRICARRRIVRWETDRPHRSWDSGGPWCARVYITTVGINPDGTFSDLFIEGDPPDFLYLTLHRDRALVGFHLICSIEWDASDEYIEHVREGFEGASDYLYEATDGQFFFERVEVRDNRSRWTYADVRIHNDIFTANSATGWPFWVYNHDWSSYQIRMPRFHGGQEYDRSGAFRTFVHEFGHYGLRLKDEYEQHVYNWRKAKYETHDRRCTHNLNDGLADYGWYEPYSACVMTWQGRANNFCDNVPLNNHATDNEQHDERGKSCWRCFRADWVDEDGDPDRWTLTRPANREGYYAGPFTIPCAVWRSVEITHNADTGAFDYLLTVETVLDDGTTSQIAGARVTHIRSSGGSRYMGETNGSGQIMLVGIHDGDQAVARWGDDNTETFFLHPPPPAPGAPESAGGKIARFDTIAEAGKLPGITKAAVTLTPPAYKVRISAEPGATTSTLSLAVSTTATLIEPPEVLIWQNEEDSGTPMTPVLTYDPGDDRYEAEIALDPLSAPRGFILARTRDIHDVPSVGSHWFEFIVPTSETLIDWESYRSTIHFWAPTTSTMPGTILYVEPTELPGPLPASMMPLQGPYRLAATGGASLAGPAILKLSYDELEAAEQVLDPDTFAIYMWDGVAENWQALESTHLEGHGEVAAGIVDTGIYVLAAAQAVGPAFAVVWPGAADTWKAGETADLQFSAINLPSPGEVYVELWQGKTKIGSLGRVPCRNGINTASRRLPSTVAPGGYQIRLFWVTSPGVNVRGETFQVPAEPQLDVTWPAAGSVWKPGTMGNLAFGVSHLPLNGEVYVELWQGNVKIAPLGRVPCHGGDNVCPRWLPGGLASGGYEIRLFLVGDTSINVRSGTFFTTPTQTQRWMLYR